MTKQPSPASTTKEPTLAEMLRQAIIPARYQWSGPQDIVILDEKVFNRIIAALESRPDTRIEELRAKVNLHDGEGREGNDECVFCGRIVGSPHYDTDAGFVLCQDCGLKLLNPPEREQG